MAGVAVEQGDDRTIGRARRTVPVGELEPIRGAQRDDLEIRLSDRIDIGPVARRNIEQRPLEHEQAAHEKAVDDRRCAEEAGHSPHRLP
jgi:hypothetical protein